MDKCATPVEESAIRRFVCVRLSQKSNVSKAQQIEAARTNGVSHMSGTIIYVIHISLPGKSSQAKNIDLGPVRHLAPPHATQMCAA
jgi:hypothetical protein